MIGKSSDADYKELCRLFFILHSDHEGANVSAHASWLVASALSDVYLASSAGMDGLAGPLHGLANQECLRWLLGVREYFGRIPDREELKRVSCRSACRRRGHPGLWACRAAHHRSPFHCPVGICQ